MDTDSFIPPTKEYQVFLKYFGKLIRSIPDPVRLAADLYSANLISESTQININAENSSQDIRNYYLLNELTSAVDLDPANLTKIISVLECHPPILKAIAEEMKAEPGLTIANPSYIQAQLQSLSLDSVEEIGKELGCGAYGVVYEVRVSGLVCAGKTLHECCTNETLDKFVKEYLSHSKQCHTNIVQLMDVRLQSLQTDVSLLNERLENTLKSKDEVIKTLESGLPASLCKISYKDQKEKIQACLKQKFKKGDKWYLINQMWFKQWKIYVGFDHWNKTMAGNMIVYPGPIDNTVLFKDTETKIIKEYLMADLDYTLLPKSAWDLLVNWYGLSVGSQPIYRYVVKFGTYVTQFKVEVYPLVLKLCIYPAVNDLKVSLFSRSYTFGTILQKMRELYGISKNDECRLWQHYMTGGYELLTDLNQTLSDVGIYNGQILMLEVRNSDGSWPSQSS